MANKRQHGAVSIFSVVFAALLLTVLTVGFIKIMIDEQQQATNNDLSQSAYDSALAGVEDAKRVIRDCQNGNTAACNEIYDSGKAEDCQVVRRAQGLVSAAETVVQSTSGAGQEDFDQAYTCVNIAMDTEDYLYEAQEGGVEMIPLRASANFNKVLIEWYTEDDAGVGTPVQTPGGVSGGTPLFPVNSNWGASAPPVVRAQVITPGASFNLSGLDRAAASQTAVIRPSSVLSTSDASNPDISLSVGGHPRPLDSEQFSNTPKNIACSQPTGSRKYSCRAVLNLGRSVSVGDSANAFLRLGTVYKGATVRVALLTSSNSPVKLKGAQPMVDSTGRANNLFRRVEARLKIGDDFPYPNYSADVKNSLCKDFSVHSSGAVPGLCTP